MVKRLFKQPIIRQRTRILRPEEFEALLEGCPKIEHKTILQCLLFTGMRFIEMKRFQKHPEWFDGDFIHLPREAIKKEKRRQIERWVRLNPQGRMVVRYFISNRKPLPTYQTWCENMQTWGRRGGLDTVGLNSKTMRKSWESWLMFCYPEKMMLVTLSQGHTTLISLQHYVNMPFTEADRANIKNYIHGWFPNE